MVILTFFSTYDIHEVILLNEQFIRDRITELRLQHNISEYQLSMDLGHSKGYINNISSGKVLPSMSEFLNICAYFNITPKEFFDTDDKQPVISHELHSLFLQLETDDQLLVLNLVKKLSSK